MNDYVHRVSDEEQAKIARFVRWFAVGTVGFVLVVIALFLTADVWLRLISIEAERRFIEPYIEVMLEHDFIDGDPVLEAYVRELAQPMYDTLDHEWSEDFDLRVYVVQSEQINAFATLGGYIFVFDGLLDALENENSLAMVLAHEVAHVHHRDPLLGAGRGLLIQMAIATLSGGSVDLGAVSVGSDLILTSYSREQEIAADDVALDLLVQRYGHAVGATALFEIINGDIGDEELARFVEFLSSHPDTDARVERINTIIEERGWTQREASPYPESVVAILESERPP
jgi:predicted Zn-dependent protease